MFGSAITDLALPLTAVLTLAATASEMGVLRALEFAPFLLFGLFAGAWVDRLRRRPILVGADFGRAVLLGLIPFAAAFHVLRIEQLYVIGFLTGVMTVFFDVAYQSFLPTLVRREQLVEGNSKLEVSRSVAMIAGPGLAGQLVEWVTAPIAIALDALSFLASAALLMRVRTAEPAPAAVGAAAGRGIWREIGEGLRVVTGNPILRSIAGCTATSNLFTNVTAAVSLLYYTRVLNLQPGELGFIFAASGPAALLGALVAGRAARSLGLGRAIVLSTLLPPVALSLIPLVESAPPALTVPLLVSSSLLFGFSIPIYNINQVSLRQAITPDHLQGRMNASMRFIVWGTIPIGALIGGALGEAIGLRETLVVGAAGAFLCVPWVAFSRVRALRETPSAGASS